MKTTYIAYNAETGNLAERGFEYTSLTDASLAAMSDSSGVEFEFRRDERGFMGIYEGDRECFVRANSLNTDDEAAKMECIMGALRDYSQSGHRSGSLLTVVRNEEGRIIDIDPDMSMDDEDRAAMVEYWSKRLK